MDFLPRSLAHLLCLPADSPRPRPLALAEAPPPERRSPPHAWPDQSSSAISDVGLRAAPGRPRAEVPVPSSRSRVAAGRRGPGCSEAGRPLAPCRQAAMQGSGGNVSRGLPGGPASTVASGAGRCESGALMHSFGIFLQGLLGVVAFSTLMRESGTPAPPRPRSGPRASLPPPQGPSCP